MSSAPRHLSVTFTGRFIDALGGIARAFDASADAVRRFGERMAEGHHRRPDGKRCYIGHPLDRPCPRWRGRNFP